MCLLCCALQAATSRRAARRAVRALRLCVCCAGAWLNQQECLKWIIPLNLCRGFECDTSKIALSLLLGRWWRL